MPGTYSADHAWYIYGRSHLVHIQATLPGTHSADHAWYILARSMTITMDIYSHHLQNMLDEATEMIDNLVTQTEVKVARPITTK